jgi:hypothetical protein
MEMSGETCDNSAETRNPNLWIEMREGEGLSIVMGLRGETMELLICCERRHRRL